MYTSERYFCKALMEKEKIPALMVGMRGVASWIRLRGVAVEAETKFGGHFEASENFPDVFCEYPFA
jgi:hypothetical protein